MPLTGAQIGRIQDALLAAFDRDELRRVIRICMNEWLDAIVSAEKPYRSQVFGLVEWADRNSRVVELLRCLHEDRSNDATLAALYGEARTWGAPVGATMGTTPPASPPVPTSPHHIFLSYSHKDDTIKNRLLADLRAVGFTVWTDEGLEPGTPIWQDAIEQAIVACKCLVVILSPNAKQSRWVKIEISYADQLGRRIFPVLAAGDSNSAVPFALSATQYIDLRASYIGQVRDKLLPALRKHLGMLAAPKPPTPGPQKSEPAMPESRALETPAPETPTPEMPTPEVPPPTPVTRAAFVEPTRAEVQPLTAAAPLGSVRAFVARMQDSSVPAAERLKAGLRADALGALPLDLDAFIPIPGLNVRIGKYPITNAQFKRFVDAGGYKPENEARWWSVQGIGYRYKYDWDEPRYWADRRFNRPAQPVVGISWYEAKAYCKWLNEARIGLNNGDTVRLPTVAEWQAAARGGLPKPKDTSHDYPWRGPFEPARANTKESNLEQTAPVHMYPAGATPDGVYDLAGNVWEWTQDMYEDYSGAFWLKGGSWYHVAKVALASATDRGDFAWLRNDYHGFRVVVVPSLAT